MHAFKQKGIDSSVLYVYCFFYKVAFNSAYLHISKTENIDPINNFMILSFFIALRRHVFAYIARLQL